jgi:hypothetical protein
MRPDPCSKAEAGERDPGGLVSLGRSRADV